MSTKVMCTHKAVFKFYFKKTSAKIYHYCMRMPGTSDGQTNGAVFKHK